MPSKDAKSAPPAPVEPDTSTESEQDGPARHLLQDHVPLSLIVDLTDPAGPDSQQILDDEGLPEEQWWLPAEHPGQG